MSNDQNAPRSSNVTSTRPVRVGDMVRSRSWNKMEWPDGMEVTVVTPSGFGRSSSKNIDVERSDFKHWVHADGAPIDEAFDYVFDNGSRTSDATSDQTKPCPEPDCISGYVDADVGRGGTNLAQCYTCKGAGRVPDVRSNDATPDWLTKRPKAYGVHGDHCPMAHGGNWCGCRPHPHHADMRTQEATSVNRMTAEDADRAAAELGRANGNASTTADPEPSPGGVGRSEDSKGATTGEPGDVCRGCGSEGAHAKGCSRLPRLNADGTVDQPCLACGTTPCREITRIERPRIERTTSTESEVQAAIREAVTSGNGLDIYAGGLLTMQIAARVPLRDLDEPRTDNPASVKWVDSKLVEAAQALLGVVTANRLVLGERMGVRYLGDVEQRARKAIDAYAIGGEHAEVQRVDYPRAEVDALRSAARSCVNTRCTDRNRLAETQDALYTALTNLDEALDDPRSNSPKSTT